MNQWLHKPLVAGSKPVTASFYIRGSQPRGWHLEQKQVPQFCTGIRSMVNGAGFATLVSNLEIEMGYAQLALGADAGIHAGAFAHPNAL
jgi:hypothetical protein